jgi:hypothetical protein
VNEIAVCLFAENSAASSLSEWFEDVYKPLMVSCSTIERLRSPVFEPLNGRSATPVPLTLDGDLMNHAEAQGPEIGIESERWDII